MGLSLAQFWTTLPKRFSRRCCVIFVIVAVVVFLSYTTFFWNWWDRPVSVTLPLDHTMSQEAPGPYHVAYPRGYKFVIDEPEKCRTGDHVTFLVLMVPVAPGNRVARDAIRKMWGNETLVQGKRVQTFFVIGMPSGPGASTLQEVAEESEMHHDILLSDFLDSYGNLTIKTMMTLEWIAARCPEASYVMKIDSDMFLNVPNLVSLLLRPETPKQNYLTGLVWWHSPVIRNPNQKFFMPYEVIAEPEYPPYPLGLGYVMSRDLPKKILEVSPQIKPIYIEDAYLGMCLKLLGIRPTEPPSKTLFDVNPFFSYDRCKLRKVIAVTTTSLQQLLSYWKDYKSVGPAC